MQRVFSFLILLSFKSSLTVCAETEYMDWFDFKDQFKKIYPNDEIEVQRSSIYEDNLMKIEKHNEDFDAGLTTYRMGINHFSDLTDEDFFSIYFHDFDQRRLSRIPGEEEVFYYGDYHPRCLDWNDLGGVTVVRNEGLCNAAYAMAAIGSLEGQMFKEFGSLTTMSVQEIIDCLWIPARSLGCKGGFPEDALDYIRTVGITSAPVYRFYQRQGDCMGLNDIYLQKIFDKNSKIMHISSGNETALEYAIANHGPVAAQINALNILRYRNGIFYDFDCTTDKAYHSVLITGYGIDKSGQNYWIIKNFWGNTWGNLGWLYLAKDKNNTCGIANNVIYPIISSEESNGSLYENWKAMLYKLKKLSDC